MLIYEFNERIVVFEIIMKRLLRLSLLVLCFSTIMFLD